MFSMRACGRRTKNHIRQYPLCVCAQQSSAAHGVVLCTDAIRMFVTNVLTKDKANIEMTYSCSRAERHMSCESGACE